jgi:hypothetical protein
MYGTPAWNWWWYIEASPALGTMVTRPLGRCAAATIGVEATYEWPVMPTRPLDQPRVAAHSTTCLRSRASFGPRWSRQPSLRPVPRRSIITTA